MRSNMEFQVLKLQILRVSWAKRLFLRAFLFSLAMSFFSIVQITSVFNDNEPLAMNFDECPLNISPNNVSRILKPVSTFAYPLILPILLKQCKGNQNLTNDVFKELMEKGLLKPDAKALCVGEGSASAIWSLKELGISYALGVERHPFFSLLRRKFIYELEFEDNYFDFVFSRGLDRVSIPALLVLEMERVLRPGGTGAVLVGAFRANSGSLIRSAIPVSSFLRSSDVVHVCGIGPLALVIFQKRLGNAAAFMHYELPDECPSVANNKPFMKFVEPIVEQNVATEAAYLPNFMNISSRKRLISVSVGAGDHLNSNAEYLLKSHYSKHLRSAHSFVVDHNITVLSSYVRNPGVTFVYHPGLAGKTDVPDYLDVDEYMEAPFDEFGFDFVRWFREMRREGDFVVMMMNGREEELKILAELFKSGAICHVDELFLHCSDNANCRTPSSCDCMSILKRLRSSGVLVHHWRAD